MMKRTKSKRFFIGIGVMLLVLILGYLAINPRLLRWGATDEEVSRAMPGDLDISVGHAASRSTRGLK